MSSIEPDAKSFPQEPPAHNCDDHSTYTFGPLGWGWYCQICGSFCEIDDMPEG